MSQWHIRGRPVILYAVLYAQIRALGGHLDSYPVAVPRMNQDGRPGAYYSFTPKGWVRCPLCLKPIDLQQKETWDGDHIVPKAQGGRNGFDNLRITHSKCNRERGDMLIDVDRVASLL